jgi:hypothetical protein
VNAITDSHPQMGRRLKDTWKAYSLPCIINKLHHGQTHHSLKIYNSDKMK